MVSSKAATIEEYLQELPPERQAVCEKPSGRIYPLAIRRR